MFQTMKTPVAHSDRNGFTLVELLVIIVIIAVLAALVLRVGSDKHRAVMTICMSNQRQIDIGLVTFCDDHTVSFPWQVSVTNGGSMELAAGNQAYPHYQTLSKYFAAASEPGILVCPADRAKHAATNFAQLASDNLSYFLNIDAQARNRSSYTLITGDRDLKINGDDVKTGLLATTQNMDIQWSGALHPHGGVLSFADGHVESTKANALKVIFARQSLATNRLVIP
jgi:prepilin-type N-terminal cleavage/methylation domain-containing protein/prepilin-type processing-associated H-X9-DG protein